MFKNRTILVFLFCLVLGFIIIWSLGSQNLSKSNFWLLWLILPIVVSVIGGLMGGRPIWFWPVAFIIGGVISSILYRSIHYPNKVYFFVPALLVVSALIVPTFLGSAIGIKLRRHFFKRLDRDQEKSKTVVSDPAKKLGLRVGLAAGIVVVIYLLANTPDTAHTAPGLFFAMIFLPGYFAVAFGVFFLVGYVIGLIKQKR